MRRTLTVALLLVAPAGVSAQLKDVTDSLAHRSTKANFGFGLQFNYMRPEGDFGRFVRQGLGATFWGGGGPKHLRQILIGLEVGEVRYGSTHTRVQLNPTIPGLFADVSTSNNIITLGIPLRVDFTRGFLKPYAVGSVGLTTFFTETSASGTSSGGEFATTTNLQDTKFSWSGGGGLAVQVLGSRAGGVFLDFTVRHVGNGTVKYLNQDSITDDGGGTTIFTPIRSQADFTLYQLGLTVRSR